MLARRQGLSRRGYRTPRLLVRLPKLPLPAGATAQTGILARAWGGGLRAATIDSRAINRQRGTTALASAPQ
jgi:hypothetical protein